MKRFLFCFFFVFPVKTLTAQQSVDSIKVATSEWLHLQQMNIEMTALLQETKKAGQVNAELIQKLREENEKLREIMRGYVQQIDELNNMNQQLATALEECEEQR